MLFLLTLIAPILFVYALIQIVRGCLLLCKAAYYHLLVVFNNEKRIDKGYEKHVIKPSEDYQNFQNGFDEKIDHIINPKNFKL